MITVRTEVSVSRAAEVSIRNRDSGVVIMMSGGRATSFRRSAVVVSPDRMPTVTLGIGSPSRPAARPIPASGARRLRSTSTASAFSGDTYNTRHRSLAAGSDSRIRPSSAQRNAASVLPDPVGAITSAFWPDEIADQAPAWAGVGSAKTSRNHAAVAGANAASGSATGSDMSSILHPATDSPRCRIASSAPAFGPGRSARRSGPPKAQLDVSGRMGEVLVRGEQACSVSNGELGDQCIDGA